MDEIWLTIACAPDYAVSSLGRVKRTAPDWQGKHGGQVLRPSRQRGGYLAHVLIGPGGVRLTKKVHRLVCEAFHGPQPEGKQCVAHRDGDVENNRPQNVYWATYLENAADRDRHGTTAKGDASGAKTHPERWIRGDDHWTRRNPERVVRGDNHPKRLRPELSSRGEANTNAKLTEAAVAEIRATPKVHGSGRLLADKFGVSMGLISAVRNRRHWAHSA